jgi:hypothetical protein
MKEAQSWYTELSDESTMIVPLSYYWTFLGVIWSHCLYSRMS